VRSAWSCAARRQASRPTCRHGAARKDIEHLAHKIYGSGAMFGFDAVSDQARALELAARAATDPVTLDQLQDPADRLEQQVPAALRARGLR
jgi:HPt (histidine-containing phosphotransfer) domain-containing protein